jgi:pilus assembly protein CpaF
MNATPMFGRRRAEEEVPGQSKGRSVVPAPAAAAPAPSMLPLQSTSDSLTELRMLALQQLDPAAAAALPAERLGPEIEKLVADIATERRIQLNGREQRQLAGELVNDMLGLGPLQPLLDDEGIADILVNGPDRVFIEKAGRVTLSNVRFRDANHLANICQRIAAGVGRRIDEAAA